jgi:hypothetical protein
LYLTATEVIGETLIKPVAKLMAKVKPGDQAEQFLVALAK